MWRAAPAVPLPVRARLLRLASSHEVAEDIRVPCLTINARDDPVVQGVQRNGYVVAVLTARGGHLGWFERRWTTDPVLEWLALAGREFVRPRGPRTREGACPADLEEDGDGDGDGFLRDARWPQLGCKRVPGGGLVDGNRPTSELFQGL